MKSKSNSKSSSQAASTNKTSLLLAKPYQKIKVRNIPQTLNLRSIQLDLQNCQISSTSGIQAYKNVQIINLNRNQISDFVSLKPLISCDKLKLLKIQDNPICGKVNYIYGIFCTLGKVIQINNIKPYCSFEQILQKQNQNGYKIVMFLLQACLILNNKLKNNNEKNNKNLMSQFKQLQIIMNFDETSLKQYQNIQMINQIIFNNFPLKSITIPNHSEDQLKQINEYFIQKLIQCNQNKPNNFIYKILSQIQVSDDLQQKQLQNKIQVTKLVIKDKIEKQFIFYQKMTNEKYKYKQNKSTSPNMNMKHLISAETALETLDTATRNKNNQYQNGIYFCMDFQFLQQTMMIIKDQIERLSFIVNEELLKKQTIQKDYVQNNQSNQPNFLHLTSYQTQNQYQLLSSPQRIYNNSSILQNLLFLLQNSIKSIAFRKIKKYKLNNINIKNIIIHLQNSLCNQINNRYKFGFNKILQNNIFQSQIVCKFQQIKLKKILISWKNLKKRKLKLLKNIIKRKIKVDTFLSAIALTRWKMNSRADRIKRMASAALLNTRVSSIPKSKKGIQLAYQRTISNRLKQF